MEDLIYTQLKLHFVYDVRSAVSIQIITPAPLVGKRFLSLLNFFGAKSKTHILHVGIFLDRVLLLHVAVMTVAS